MKAASEGGLMLLNHKTWLGAHLWVRWPRVCVIPSLWPCLPGPPRASDRPIRCMRTPISLIKSVPETGDPGMHELLTLFNTLLLPPAQGRAENIWFPYVFVFLLSQRTVVPTFSKKEQIPHSLGPGRQACEVCLVSN